MAFLFLPIAIVAGMAFLQSRLCRSGRLWRGLVLPGITLLLSIIGLLNVASERTAAQTALAAFEVFAICNIPTVIFLVILVSRRKRTAAADGRN